MLIKMMYDLIIREAILERNEASIEECTLFALAGLVMLPFEIIIIPIDILGGIIYLIERRKRE